MTDARCEKQSNRSIYNKSLILGLLITIAGAGVTSAEAPSWGKFQNGGSNASKMKLPTEWSPDKNIAWTAEITGYGQSTPIVAHDQIVVTSTSGDKKDNYHVLSYNIADGKKRWQIDLTNPTPYANTPMVSRAAPSAIATEDGFIAFFEGGALAAISPVGEKQWELDLVAKHGAIEARHGLASSLEQDADHVFVWVERGEEPYLLALNKKSGEEVWKAPGLGATSWSSPRMIPVGEGHHLVCSAIGKVVGFDPATGERLWELDEIANNSSCTPTPTGDGRFLIGASNGRGETNPAAAAENNGLVEIKKQDDGKFAASFKWRAEKATSSFGSPVVAGDTAAIVNRTGVLYRLDLNSGEQVSVDRTDAGGIWATPIVSDGLIYLFGYKGTTSVISLEDGKEIATNRCWEDAGKSPGFGGGTVLYAAAPAAPYLIIRSGDKLFAIGKGS